MASDGVWDFMTPLEVTSFVAQYANPSNRENIDVSEMLVEEVLRRAALESSAYYKKDITIKDLKELPPGRSRRSKYDDTTALVIFLT